jgi:hypothetical protein
MAVLEYTRSPVDSTVKVDMKMYAQALTRLPFECIAFFSSPQKAPCWALHEYCRSSDQDEWARLPRYAHMYSITNCQSPMALLCVCSSASLRHDDSRSHFVALQRSATFCKPASSIST